MAFGKKNKTTNQTQPKRITAEDIKKLKEEIAKKIPDVSNDIYNWSNYDEALSYMNNLVWINIFPNIRKNNPMAFATRSGGTTGAYEIFVNDEVGEESETPLQLHEFGHVLFNHLSLQDKQREIQTNKVLTYWPKISKYVDLSDAIEKNGGNAGKVQREYAYKMAEALLNIVMDMEVNSKLFTKDEWENMKYLTNIAYLKVSTSEKCSVSYQELEVLNKHLDEHKDDLKDNPIANPIWPEDYEFPLQLTYGEYLDLMLKDENLENTMNQLQQMMQKMKGQGQGQGQGDDDGDGQSQGQGKMSADDIDNLRNQFSDADDEKNQEEIKEAEAQDAAESGDGNEDGKGKSSGGDEDGDDGDDDFVSGGGQRGGDGWSPTGKSNDDPTKYIEGSNNPEVRDFITKKVFSQQILNTKSNVMYNYNRRKHGNLIITKSTKEDVWRPGNIYMVVDCSGSINEKAVKDFIATTKEISKKCGPKSRIVWWDTRLEGDYRLTENEGPHGCGGTDIASGIAYVRDTYDLQKNDKMFIISDFEDGLYQWNRELEKVKCDCFAICWTNQKVSDKYSYIERCNYCSDDPKAEAKKLLKRVDTAFVNIYGNRGY